MEFSKNPLVDLTRSLHNMNVVLAKARDKYLSLEAERKHLEAKMTLDQMATSHAGQVTRAQAMPEWLEFHKKLARAESEYEFQRLKFSIMEKEFQAQYLEIKLNDQMIKKEQS